MRIETVEKRIYGYEDLLLTDNIDLKNKVLEKLHDINIYFDNITDEDESFNLFLKDIGFLDAKIYYDCSYSQGSGACFDCTKFDIDLLLKDYTCKHKKWIIDIIKNNYSLVINKRGNSNLYCHENTRYFGMDGYLSTYNELSRIYALIDDIEKYIESIRLDACQELYSMLCKQFEYLQSEKAILETIQANEYEFDEHGNII